MHMALESKYSKIHENLNFEYTEVETNLMNNLLPYAYLSLIHLVWLALLCNSSLFVLFLFTLLASGHISFVTYIAITNFFYLILYFVVINENEWHLSLCLVA